MSKIIPVVIILLIFLFQFPNITKAGLIPPNNFGIVISNFGELLVGESKSVKVSGLQPGGLYYWSETNVSNVPQFVDCIRADSLGVINETIGPYDTTGTYSLNIISASQDSVEGGGSTQCFPDDPANNPQEAFATFYVVLYTGVSVSHNPTPVTTDSVGVTFTISTTSDMSTSQDFSYNTWRDGIGRDSCSESTGSVKPIDPRTIKITNTITGCRAEVGNWHLEVWQGAGTTTRSDSTLIVRDYGFSVEQGTGSGALPECTMRTDPDPLLFTTSPSALFIVNVGDTRSFTSWKMEFECGVPHNVGPAQLVEGPSNPEIYRELNNYEIGGLKQPCEFQKGDHTIKVIGVSGTQSIDKCKANYAVQDPSILYGTCTVNFNLLEPDKSTVKDNNCTNGAVPYIILRVPTIDDPTARQCVCMPPSWSGSTISQPLPYTTPVTSGGDQCVVEGSPGFKTAIGCIPTNPDQLVQAVLKFVIGISGGLAFLLMLLGAFQMLSSAGNPETLHAGKDRFTQAIIGLLFVIFSVLLLQIIGVDILGLRELKPP